MDVFRLNLELDKTRPVINEPVTFRRKDGGWGGTQVIATITDHGQPASGISNAVFMCTKPDKKFIRDGSVSINGNVITYTLNNEIGTCPGIIRLAYFQINSTVSTQNFQINVEEAISPISQSDNYDSEIQQIMKSMTNASQEEIDKFKTYLGSARNNYIYTNNGKLVLSKNSRTLTLPPNLIVTIGNNSFACTNTNQTITFKNLVQFVIFNIEKLQIEIKDLGTLTPNEVVLGYFDLNNNNALINIKDSFLVDDEDNAINQIQANQIANNSLTRDKLDFYKPINDKSNSDSSGGTIGPNIFNPTTMNEGTTCYGDGTVTFKLGFPYYPDGFVSIKIPVKPSTTYKRGIQYTLNNEDHLINNSWTTFWDKNMNVITSVALMSDISKFPDAVCVDDEHRYYFTTTSNTAYVRIAIQKNFLNSFTFQEIKGAKQIAFDGYIDEKLYIKKDHVIDEESTVSNPKSIDFIGDSITYGYGATKSYVGYFKDIAEDNGIQLTAVNHGINGTTIAQSSVPNSMVERFNKDLTPSDIIIILGGTNDYMQNVPISEDDESTDTSTFNGALNVMMSGLLNNFSAKIVFLTPLRAKAKYDWMSEVEDNNILKNKAGNTLRDYCDCLVKMGQKYGIEVIDWNNNLGMNPNYEASAKYFNSDKLHPNDLGHQFMAHQLYKDIGNFLV